MIKVTNSIGGRHTSTPTPKGRSGACGAPSCHEPSRGDANDPDTERAPDTSTQQQIGRAGGPTNTQRNRRRDEHSFCASLRNKERKPSQHFQSTSDASLPHLPNKSRASLIGCVEILIPGHGLRPCMSLSQHAPPVARETPSRSGRHPPCSSRSSHSCIMLHGSFGRRPLCSGLWSVSAGVSAPVAIDYLYQLILPTTSPTEEDE